MMRKISRRAELLPRTGISRRRMASALLAIGVITLLAVALVPADKSSAYPDREGTNCGSGGSCHKGAQTPAMLSVSGLPSGSYTPSQPYTLIITITDTNDVTGENNFVLIATAGVFTTTDANAEINSLTIASASDSVSPMTVASWTVVWTAPSSGSAQIDVWAVMGDGAGGSVDIWDTESYTYTAIPEFPLVLIPVIGIAAVVILVSRTRKG
jgi:hypothetical protein